jgi:hypothetical protein
MKQKELDDLEERSREDLDVVRKQVLLGDEKSLSICSKT